MSTVKLSQVAPSLHHLAEVSPVQNAKVYPTLAVAAYLVRSIDPGSNFFGSLSTRVKKFPVLSTARLRSPLVAN